MTEKKSAALRQRLVISIHLKPLLFSPADPVVQVGIKH